MTRALQHRGLPRSGGLGRGGFTLVELLVVLIVLGIVSAAILPNLSGATERMRLETAAQHVSALIDYGYHAATASGRVHGLLFSEDGAGVTLVAHAPEDPQKGTASGEEEEPELTPVSLPGPLDEELPEGVRLLGVEFAESEESETEMPASDTSRILFYPDGTTEFATLRLGTMHGDMRLVRVNGLSGSVTVSDPAASAGAGEEE